MPERPKVIKTVALIGKYAIEKDEALVCEMYNYIKKRKYNVLFDESVGQLLGEEGMTKAQLMKKADLAVVLGGDGTLLKTARSLGKRKVMVYGINLGNVGFLTESPRDKAMYGIKRVLSNKYVLDKRMMLRVTVYRNSKKIYTDLALNEAVISQGAKARIIKLRVEMNQRKVNTYMADGLIISSPSGSTGHSLSAGGPVVHPKIAGLLITPICPVSLTNRPIILPNDRQINITVETVRQEHERVALTLDGQQTFSLEYGDQVKVRKSSRILYLIRMTGENYYRALRAKLKWGD